jgi:hypothetical protein
MRYPSVAVAIMLTLGLGLALAQDSGATKPDQPAASTAPSPPSATKPPLPPGPPPGPPEAGPPDRGQEKRHPGSGMENDRSGGRFRVPHPFRDVTEEEVADILAFTGEHMPWLKQELEKTRQGDPDRFRAMCRRLRFEIGQLRALKEQDPEAFKKALQERQLKFRGMDVAAKIRSSTSPEERARLVEELRKMLNQQFDLEMATQGAMIKRLEERLAQVRTELKERSAKRAEILKNRLDEMLTPRPEPDTGPPEPRPESEPPAPPPPPPPAQPKS